METKTESGQDKEICKANSVRFHGRCKVRLQESLTWATCPKCKSVPYKSKDCSVGFINKLIIYIIDTSNALSKFASLPKSVAILWMYSKSDQNFY